MNLWTMIDISKDFDNLVFNLHTTLITNITKMDRFNGKMNDDLRYRPKSRQSL